MPEKTTLSRPVTDFIESYKNLKTRSNYEIAIKHYLLFVFPPKYTEKYPSLDGIARSYLAEVAIGQQKPLKDVRRFSIYLTERYAPTTTHLYLRSVFTWLDDSGYKISRREQKRLSSQLPPPHPRHEQVELRRKTFRAVFFALPEDIGVLLIFLLASGMRIGEALQLRQSDIFWGGKRPEIYISEKISKTRVPRTTYLTKEAADILFKYLQNRRDSRDELFLITYARAQKVLHTVSVELGLTRIISGKPYGIHWHMTRKWFLSRFSLAASRDIAEHIAGHEGYLSRSYRRYSRKQILKQYKRAEKKLTILEEGDFYDGLGGI